MVEAEAVKKVIKKAPKKAVSKPIDKSLFAIFATGGKQYKARVGDRVKIEKINPSTGSTSSQQASSGQAYKEGDTITFDHVLIIDNGSDTLAIGTPFIKGAEVRATLSKIGRNKTVDVIRYKQKSRYFKKYGHRQPYFEVTIDSIK